MKQVYLTYCTEYEAGWGQRPDGIALCEDLEKLKTFIKDHSTGSPDYYWRYSDPSIVFTDAKNWKKLSANSKTGIVSLDRLPDGFYTKA